MNKQTDRFSSHVAVTLSLVAVAVAGFLGLMVMGGGISLPGKTYEVKAVMPTVSSLIKGSRVTMSGAQVGEVTQVKREGLGAVAKLKLTEKSVFPLPKDSTIRLRQRTPIGENYVSIDPGSSSSTLPDGATVPMSQAEDFVDVDQILSVLNGKTQQRARDLIQSTGGPLKEHGEELNGVIGGLTGTIIPTADVVHIAHKDRQQAAGLVRGLGQLMAGIGERDNAINTVARQGRQTVRAIGEKDDSMKRLVHELPATLSQLRSTSNTVDQVTGRSAPVLDRLAVALREVRPAVRRLQPAAQEGRGVVNQLGPAAPRLEQTLKRLRTLSDPATKALPELRRTMCQLNPAVKYSKPYAQDIAAFIVGMGSSANAYDAVGHAIRLIPVVSENEAANLPADTSQALAKLLRTGLLGKLSPLTYYPIPKPGEVGRTAKDLPSVTSAAGLAASGYKYPRVEAAC